MVQFESVNGPILYGGAVRDGGELVMWLRPSIWLAARQSNINQTIFERGFTGEVRPLWTMYTRGGFDH